MKSVALLLSAIRRWLNRKPETGEPGPMVRVPIHKDPGGRSAAAVAEVPELPE